MTLGTEKVKAITVVSKEDEFLWDKAGQIAEERGQSRSEFMLEALRAYLRVNEAAKSCGMKMGKVLGSCYVEEIKNSSGIDLLLALSWLVYGRGESLPGMEAATVEVDISGEKV